MEAPPTTRNAALAAVVEAALTAKKLDSVRKISEATGIAQTTVARRLKFGNFTTFEIFRIGDVVGTPGSKLFARAEKIARSERIAA